MVRIKRSGDGLSPVRDHLAAHVRNLGMQSIPDEQTILNFRDLLAAGDLAEVIFKQVNVCLAKKGLLLKRGSIVDVTIIAAPCSMQNASSKRP